MRNILDQIEQAVEANLYYVALFTTLAVPDICGAIDSDDGRASGAKYAAWFDKHVSLSSDLTGDTCYRFRCSLLHQGRARLPNTPFERVLFVEPGKTPLEMHMLQINGALVIDLRLFCRDVVDATRKWLAAVENTKRFTKNFAEFARVHPRGLAPYIVGPPIVG